MDETDLTVPKAKQTLFVAHEILQMKPVYDPGAMYDRFLNANEWIYTFFPNAKDAAIIHTFLREFVKGIDSPRSPSLFESVVKRLQLVLINRHKTTEMVSDTQLWFFPDDYERKVRVSR